MSSPLLVKISRDGKEIGTYEVKEAVRLLVYGTLKETDFYWHEGMTEWASLSKLQASEARRELAERAVQLKQEEANRAIAEAVWARHKSEKENRFRCHSCQNFFVYPKKQGGIFWRGIAFILLSGLAFFITYSVADIHRPSPSGFFFGSLLLDDPESFLIGRVRKYFSIGGLVLLLFGLIFTVEYLTATCCPECESTNFSRPEKTDEQK